MLSLVGLLCLWTAGAALNAPISFLAGPPDGGGTSVTVDPNIVVADGVSYGTVNVYARDRFGNAVSNANVTLAGSGGNNIFGASVGKTGTNGIFSTTLASTQVQAEVITALFDNGIVANSNAYFKVGPADTNTSTLSVSPSNTVADGTATAVATLILKDRLAHPIAGTLVVFSADGASTSVSAPAATNTSGQTSVMLTSTVAQNENVMATAGTASLSASVFFVPGPPDSTTSSLSVNPNSAAADGNSPLNIAVILADRHNNRIANQNVVFSINGSAGPLVPWVTRTGGAGLGRSVVTSTTAGPSTIWAHVGSFVLNANTTFGGTPSYCAGNPNFSLSSVAIPQGYSQYAAAGDFNGDGLLDFAYTDSQNASLRVYLGSTNGGFTAAASNGTGNTPGLIVAGDFNADGILDLASTAYNSATLNIYFGNGNGTFQARVSKSVGTNPQGVAAADFDSDGIMDFAVVNQASNSVSVLMGTSPGAYQTQISYSAGTAPFGIRAEDLNNDGKIDIAVTSQNTNSVVILIGKGNGSFQSQVAYPAGNNPLQIASRDINGDGATDLIMTNLKSNSVSVLIGTGLGSFSAPSNYAVGTSPQGIAIGDFNGDAVPDFVVSSNTDGTAQSFLGSGSGSFTASTTISNLNSPKAFVVGDFNGDRRQDVLVLNVNLNQYINLLSYNGCN